MKFVFGATLPLISFFVPKFSFLFFLKLTSFIKQGKLPFLGDMTLNFPDQIKFEIIGLKLAFFVFWI